MNYIQNYNNMEETFIYESPDKGLTIFRRPFGLAFRKQVGNKSLLPFEGKKIAIVLGAGGFIGSHLVKRLREEGYWVRGVDLKYSEHWQTQADDFIIGDLRDPKFVSDIIMEGANEVYQLAADMGGAGYIFTGDNDANVMHNSALINLNVVHECVIKKVGRVFYSSSACMYPEHNQLDPNNPNCKESSAYPANPDSEYGWEKLFSERLFLAFNRNYKLDIRIARFHNIFGPYGTWIGGKEKAPAAMCRKAARVREGESLEVWGDGEQTRSFLYIDECIQAIRHFMNQEEFIGPVNIGSEEMVTINELASIALELAKKTKTSPIANISGEEFQTKYGFPCPVGVRGRNSDNTLYKEYMNWAPSMTLRQGMKKTFTWINKVVNG
jgi:nucleoside-diphosphate-sugar epimerase